MAKKKEGGKGKGTKKFGRQKRKDARRGSPISLFARGKISGETYFKLTNQPLRLRG